MFIFSIRGPIFQPPGYAFSFQQLGQPDRSTFDETVQKINTFFTYAEENYPIDPQQIYLMGFSQGAIMSMAIGIQSIDKIKGIIALSGYIPSFIKEEYKEQALSKMNIFVSHGFGDEVLPYHWAKESVEFLKQSGANVVLKPIKRGIGSHKKIMWI